MSGPEPEFAAQPESTELVSDPRSYGVLSPSPRVPQLGLAIDHTTAVSHRVAAITAMQRHAGNTAVTRAIAGVSRQQIMMLTDRQLDVEYHVVRAWVLDPGNRAAPVYRAMALYLARLEAVVASRVPQQRRRIIRQEAAAGIARILPVEASLGAFVLEVIYGMCERLEQLPRERSSRAVVRLREMSAEENDAFTFGYMRGVVNGVWDEVKGLMELITLPLKLIEWLNRMDAGRIARLNAFADRLIEVRARMDAAVGRALDEFRMLEHNPIAVLRQLRVL